MVGMVFDSPAELGDKSFNDSANAGLEKAKAEFKICAQDRSRVPQREKDYENELGSNGVGGLHKLVFAVGVSQIDALKVVAPKHPDAQIRNRRFVERSPERSWSAL